MKANCYIVNDCRFEQKGEKKQIIHSSPIESISVATLPFVNNFYAVIELSGLEAGEDLALFITISDHNDKIIAFTDENNTVAFGEKMKTFCKIQATHSYEEKHKLILYCNGSPSHTYEYMLKCDDQNLVYVDDIELVNLRLQIGI